MMARSRANEIAELVLRLGSRSRARVDAARARLSIIGTRAVVPMIEALEGTNNRVRTRVMPLLAAIQDPRGREPLIAMLLDRNARMRQVAARCLARFPAPDAVAALERSLEKEKRKDVRIAAVHALVEQYSGGQDGAVRRVLDALVDQDEHPEVRLASFSLLHVLRSSQRRSILELLGDDPNEAVREQARKAADEPAPTAAPSRQEILGWLERLGEDDYAVWNEAVQRLSACGAGVIDPLVDTMRDRAEDPEYCTRAGIVLKSLGPRRGRALGKALERVHEPLPLQTLIEVIGALGEKSLIYRLKDLIDRLAEQPGVETGFDPCLRVRAKAHVELARIGSRVAIADLRESLNRDNTRVDLDLISAVSQIGKRDELSLLLRAWGREDPFTRRNIAAAVRAIMKRERIRRNARILRTLQPAELSALLTIVPPAADRRTRLRKRR
jgi:HEAT repeat protein